ncbi:Cell-wall peptidase NlpC/P60 protein [Corynebacterium kutscheri]|uniref:Cell wall-associated hydrolase, invasion-associated protein n=1 Tax=Corynebacterium kutscheri TaxID=35755 RepID=A0A0F6TDU6_9CORY|nr:NlpC/P60 family protein [Corynebacterium kutscheri]AKE41584.1 cell wall-associated hydrolase, invasion-associated protein [Corynebacterium kutscheri]VEH08863.1 Cell-wall peptidase NlpC/P60 protein [Corynebacterium kutscheri]VEH09908.1 Cell-wall peptidase NlpC/P60 protein [Corynebacterium kutscheri]VEH79992.1 Cell-wall peptidase NlpC/P60 protein [Corynebacterium kutscheri]
MKLSFRKQVIGVSLIAAISIATGGYSLVNAQDVENLIVSMDEISHLVGAKNEEVKQLEIDLEEAQKELDALRGQVDIVTSQADAAKAQEEAYRGEVNRIAGALYRGHHIDPLSNALGADSPQNAIDRAAYLTILSKSTEEAATVLSAATKEAADARSEVTRAVAALTFQQKAMATQRIHLDKEQEALKARTEEIMQQVRGLSPADRQRWIDKNGPIEYSIAGLSSTNEAGLIALQAAMTKLGSPYGWGSIGPDAFDCSGLVYWAYQQQGKTVPRTSQAQMAGGQAVSREELQPGDIVGYYPGATHVGIYAGNGMLVHASDYGIPVQVVSVDSMPFYGARRY